MTGEEATESFRMLTGVIDELAERRTVAINARAAVLEHMKYELGWSNQKIADAVGVSKTRINVLLRRVNERR